MLGLHGNRDIRQGNRCLCNRCCQVDGRLKESYGKLDFDCKHEHMVALETSEIACGKCKRSASLAPWSLI